MPLFVVRVPPQLSDTWIYRRKKGPTVRNWPSDNLWLIVKVFQKSAQPHAQPGALSDLINGTGEGFPGAVGGPRRTAGPCTGTSGQRDLWSRELRDEPDFRPGSFSVSSDAGGEGLSCLCFRLREGS